MGGEAAGGHPARRRLNPAANVFTRAAIASLPPLAATVRCRHGDVHPETVVERLVQRLVEDLGPHMLKEERILFPYILSLEAPARGADA